VTFEEWCEQEGLDYLSDRVDVRYIWESAQQEERERIVKRIFEATNGHGNHDYLLEKINDH
jgi:hypothetical protein